MRLKKIAQATAILISVLAFTACTHQRAARTGYVCQPTMQAGPEVQATGIGERENFNDEEGMSEGPSARGANKRIYYFDYDSNVVHEEDKPAIMANADYLMAHPQSHIILEGHTDPRGSREYNVALGERRARAVAEMLESRGVNPRQIRVVSYGAERLAASEHNEASYQLDRRAVIVYIKK